MDISGIQMSYMNKIPRLSFTALVDQCRKVEWTSVSWSQSSNLPWTIPNLRVRSHNWNKIVGESHRKISELKLRQLRGIVKSWN